MVIMGTRKEKIMERLRVYSKEMGYSYTLGPYPTFEIIKKRPELVIRVILSEGFREREKMIRLLEEKGISYTFEEKTLERIGNKKKIFAAAVFKKELEPIKEGNHLLLEEVRDMGNLGTIIRTMAGFGFKDLVLLGNTCDIFNPKVIRGSMGSFFGIRISAFENLSEYRKQWKEQNIYAFVLDEESRRLPEIRYETPYTLCFGNEGDGLSEDFYGEGIQKIFIPQTEDVDSLNLTLACGVGMYEAWRHHV